jgi:squalene-associated FAD-dependent desaturase
MKQPIVIIGAGWAGIAAAVHAVRNGMRVVLVEERPYLGGRARSFVDRTTGEVIDNGQHLMMGAYRSTLSTIQQLGTASTYRAQRALRVRFVESGGKGDVLDAAVLGVRGKLGVALGILRLRGIGLGGRLAALRFAVRLQLGVVKTKGRTCLEMLRAEGQTDDAITRLWEPIVLATLNAPMDRAAASLLTTVLGRAFFGAASDSALLIPTDGLSAFIDPVTTLVEAAGGSVVTSTSVESIHAEGQRVTDVVLSNGQTINPAGVICAVPPRALSRIDGAPRVEIDGLTYSPIVSIYLWYDKAWLDDVFVAVLGTTIQWVFNRRRMVNASAEITAAYPGHVALTISAGSHLVDRPAEDIIAACDAELRTVFASMHGARLLHGLVIKEKAATFLATPDVEAQRPPCTTHFANLMLAGDWTDTGLPATIEGAAQSGITAADKLVEQLRSRHS